MVNLDEKTLYDHLGDYGIIDGKYELYHITPRRNLASVMDVGLVPPESPAEQLFGPRSPTGEKRYVRGVYLITEEIHVPVFLEEFVQSSSIPESELVVLRVTLPIVWPVEADPESLSMGVLPLAVISHRPIKPKNISVYGEQAQNPAPTGTCYEDAWRFLIKEEEGYLVHGSVQFSAKAPRINHAWVELTTGWVWEPQTKSYYTIEDFAIMSPVEEYRYAGEQAAIMVARSGNMGPWSDEERAQWLTGNHGLKSSAYAYGWYLIDRKANDAEYSFPEYTEDEAIQKVRQAVEERYNVFYYDQPGWVATGIYHAPTDLNPASMDDIKPYVTGFTVT